MPSSAGIRGVDTANQLKHYDEGGVATAISDWGGFPGCKKDETAKCGKSKPGSFFIQTKYSAARDQDVTKFLPYNRSMSINEQVLASFKDSRAKLGRVDSFLLHASFDTADENYEAWAAMEHVMLEHEDSDLGVIGVSNFNVKQLKELINHEAKVIYWPFVVQNRMSAKDKWDKEMRMLCKRKGIVYQGFSILTANRDVLNTKQIAMMAAKYKITKQQLLIRFGIQLGISVLVGATNVKHVEDDLLMVGPEAMEHVSLTKLEMDTIENIHELADLGHEDGHDETTAITTNWQNQLDHNVELFWDDGLGRLFPQGEIEPFMTKEIKTFHGHTFVVKNQDGEDIKQWQADAVKGLSQSVTVSLAVTVAFENRYPKRHVNVYWVDHDGGLVQEGDKTLAPGEYIRVNTEHGHGFVVNIAQEGPEVELLRWTANATHGESQTVMVPPAPDASGLATVGPFDEL